MNHVKWRDVPYVCGFWMYEYGMKRKVLPDLSRKCIFTVEQKRCHFFHVKSIFCLFFHIKNAFTFTQNKKERRKVIFMSNNHATHCARKIFPFFLVFSAISFYFFFYYIQPTKVDNFRGFFIHFKAHLRRSLGSHDLCLLHLFCLYFLSVSGNIFANKSDK